MGRLGQLVSGWVRDKCSTAGWSGTAASKQQRIALALAKVCRLSPSPPLSIYNIWSSHQDASLTQRTARVRQGAPHDWWWHGRTHWAYLPDASTSRS